MYRPVTPAGKGWGMVHQREIILTLCELFHELDEAHQAYALTLARGDFRAAPEAIERLAEIRRRHAELAVARAL